MLYALMGLGLSLITGILNIPNFAHGALFARQPFGRFDRDRASRNLVRRGRRAMCVARLDDTPFRYPVRLEAKTGFGTIRGKTLFFRERPLTDEEKASMGR